MVATFGNSVQSRKWQGGAGDRGLLDSARSRGLLGAAGSVGLLGGDGSPGLLGAAGVRGVDEGVSSSDCVAVDHRQRYRHKLVRIVVGMLSTSIQKFEIDRARRVVEVGGGSGWRRMVEVGGGSG